MNSVLQTNETDSMERGVNLSFLATVKSTKLAFRSPVTECLDLKILFRQVTVYHVFDGAVDVSRLFSASKSVLVE